MPDPTPKPPARRRPARWAPALSCLLLAAALAVAGACASAAAEAEKRYTTELAPTGDKEVDAALSSGSLLLRLEGEPPPSPAALIARARADAATADTVLRALGYFDGTVAITLAGAPLGDPALSARLSASPIPVPIVIRTTLGGRTEIGDIAVLGPEGRPLQDEVPGFDALAVAGLERGAPARGADILAAEGRVLEGLRARGHAYARTLPRTLLREPARQTLSVTLRFAPGQPVRIGHVRIEGLVTVERSVVAARLAPLEGRLLTPAELAEARRSLLKLGVFAVVRAEAAPHLAADGTAEVVFTVTERLPRIVSFNAAYASSEGGSAGASWTHRNLFGRAERLEISGEVNGLGERGFDDLGYRLGVQFTKPDVLRVNQSLTLNAAALREVTDAYDKESVGGGVTMRRPLTRHLTGGLGVTLSQSRITQGDVTSNYTLLGLPGTLLWDDTGDRLDRTRGARAELTLTPYPIAEGSVAGLTTLRVDAATYHAFDDHARTVLALRAQFGAAFGATPDDLPADLRMYAGGSGTIRGFAFQSVGPLDASGRPLGGSTLVAGTIELRQRIGEQWGVVGFVDSGGVGEDEAPEWPGRIGTGVGAGVRYYTAIGPLRADIAIPVSGKRDGDAAWQVYFGIGQAF